MPSLISESKKFIYIHNAKVAGMSITNVLQPFSLKRSISSRVISKVFNQHIIPYRVNSKSASSLPYFDHIYNGHLDFSTICQIIPNYLLQNYFIFSFVRNPFDKAISEYNFIKRTSSHFLFNAIASKSFYEYLLLLPEIGYQTQYSFLGGINHLSKISFVGHFESIENDWELISRKLNLPQTSLPHKNISNSSKILDLSDCERNLVKDLYRDDFEFFYPSV